MAVEAATGYHTNNAHIGGVAGEALGNNLCATKRAAGIFLADADNAPMGSIQNGPYAIGESCTFVPREAGHQFRGTFSGTLVVDDHAQTTTDGVLIANGTSGSTVVDDGSGNVAYAKLIKVETATLGIFAWL